MSDGVSNQLRGLDALGQSVWLDFIDRAFLVAGGLSRLIEEDGVSGVTSNPSIFEKAIAHSAAYDRQLKDEWVRPGAEPRTVYDALVASDVSTAADLLLSVHRDSGGRDGYVSVEVSPESAADTDRTIDEARHWWSLIDRPNLMIKVPGTQAGIPAVRRLIAEGINVNVTLLFAIDRYQEVLDAYIAGLEQRAAGGLPIDRIVGVASFFVSRIDVAIDQEADTRIAKGDAQSARLRDIKGQVAVANAKMAYQHYLDVTKRPRWRSLAANGAQPQRLLWASTGTKNPAYSDVIYVERLIGPDTINTIPPKTMDAFRDHGIVARTLDTDIADARSVLDEATALGIDLRAITAELLRAGVAQFAEAADLSIAAVAAKQKGARPTAGARAEPTTAS